MKDKTSPLCHNLLQGDLRASLTFWVQGQGWQFLGEQNTQIGMVDQQEQEIQIVGLGSNGQHKNG